MMRSLRLHLILGTTGAMAAVYLVMAVVLYIAIHRSLWTEFDNSLAVKARALIGLTEQGDKGIKLDLEPGQLGPEQSGDGFALWTEDGKTIASSASMQDAQRPTLGASANESYGFSRLSNGRRVRYTAFRFRPRLEDEEHPPAVDAQRPLTLLFVRDTAPLDHKLQQLVGLLALLCGVTMLASAGTMIWVIRRGLRPLGVLAQQIHQIGENDLGERLRLPEAPTEIQPVIERLNELLVRLDASFARERSFTADVAHELRTPLAGLTTALEVCRGQRRSPDEYERVIDRCVGVSRGMRGMIENLLTLARADAGQLTIRPQPVDVDVLLKDAWPTYERRAVERRLEVVWTLAPQVEVHTDKGLLEMVIRNLLDNAVIYTDEGGRIDIQSQSHPSGVDVAVRNSGSQVSPQDAERIFDRFWRGDAARTTDGQHCGLGLALCRRIAALLGGRIRAETTTGGRFEVILSLPSRSLPPQSPDGV